MSIPTVKYNQPIAIIFVGAPASGKTTFAKKLLSQLPFAYFSSDQVESYLTPHVDFFDDHELILNFSFELIKQLVREKVSVIFDFSIDNLADRKKLKEAIESLGGILMIVYFESEDETIFRRIQSSNVHIVEGSKKGFVLDKDYYQFKKSKIQSPLGEGAFVVKEDDDIALEKFVSLIHSKIPPKQAQTWQHWCKVIQYRY